MGVTIYADVGRDGDAERDGDVTADPGVILLGFSGPKRPRVRVPGVLFQYPSRLHLCHLTRRYSRPTSQPGFGFRSSARRTDRTRERPRHSRSNRQRRVHRQQNSVRSRRRKDAQAVYSLGTPHDKESVVFSDGG